jgi:hypothetical protein
MPATIEHHPSGQVGEFAGDGEKITPHTLVGEPSAQVLRDIRSQVPDHGRPGVIAASPLVYVREQRCHVPDGNV